MTYLKKIISGYHISYLRRKENFKSVEQFNDYTYKLSFFEFSILSSSHIFLPISILLCVMTTLHSHSIVLISLIFSVLCATIVSKKVKNKFSMNWFMVEIVRPVDEMTAEQHKKLLVKVILWHLLNVGLIISEIIILIIVYRNVRGHL